MTQAIPVLNAVTVSYAATFDGVRWFQSEVPELCYDKFKTMPCVVTYMGKTFRKASFNTDHGTVSYRESYAVAIGA